MTCSLIKGLVPALVLLIGTCMADPTSEVKPETGTQPPTTNVDTQTDEADYTFDKPDVSFALPEELKEISGLTLLSNQHLGVVQDEDGILFMLNRETGAIEARHPFGEAGDYEGIEQAGDKVFVLRSDGTLIELTNWSQPTPQSRSYQTSLKEKNDTEGLGYDAAKGRLLIACKEDPGSNMEDNQNAIYAFDLSSGSLNPDPAYVIDLEDVSARLKGRKKFKPSAVAVHPVTGDLYILSTTAHALIVLSEDGIIQRSWSLPKTTFEQPESLAFLPDGTLFIASEGDEGPAMLYQFSYQTAAR